MKKDKRNGDLIQVLLNIVILGIFAIVENWLLFFYGQSWSLVVIFGVLMILVSCLLAINIYNCAKSMSGAAKGAQAQPMASTENDKQIYALLYKQMKDIQKKQLISTKVVLDKMSSISAEDKEQIREMLETMLADIPMMTEKAGATAADSSSMAEGIQPVAEKDTEEEVLIPQDVEPEPDEEALMPQEAEPEPEEEVLIPQEAEPEPEEEALNPQELDEAAVSAEDSSQQEEDIAIEDILGGEPLDPNKELTPEEIAALFANVN